MSRSVVTLGVVAGVVCPLLAAAQPAPLTFRAAVDLALSRNLELAAVRRGRPIREAEVRAAGQIPNPDVSFEATKDTPHQMLSFNIPLEITGVRSRRIDLAREELTLADIDERAVTQVIRRDVRLAFYGLVAADQRVRLAREIADVARRVREAAQARFDAGASPRLDVLAAELGLGRAQADVDLAEAERVAAQADLNAVLNQPPGQALAVVGDLAEAPPLPTPEQAVTIAATSNIDLLTADREAAIEERRVDLLRTERVPTPVFSTGVMFNSPGEFDVGGFAGVGITLPIFSRNQGEIARSQAVIEQTHARRDAVRRSVENRLFGALARLEARQKRVIVFRDTLVPSATSLQQLAEESYRLGRITVVGVLEAQRSLRDLMIEYLQAQTEFQNALADLEEILGEPIS